MKSVAKPKVVPKPEYPHLMHSVEGRVVLFTSGGCGSLVNDPTGLYKLGHHSISWDMSCFHPYDGEVVLSN